jgi:multidrug efflux pump subunit AcrA (membrane-fusion protein)
MSREDAVPFLSADPPPTVVRALSAVLLAGFALTIALSVILVLPVTVDGRFSLVPVRGADPLRAPRAGIVSEVTAAEGVAVEQGAPLFRVRSETAGDRAGEIASLEIAVKGAEQRLENARARHESQEEADREQLRGLDRRIASLGREIALADQRVTLANKLLVHTRAVFAERLTGFEEVSNKELELARAEMEKKRLESEQDDARTSVEKLKREMAVRDRELAETERELREEADRSRASLAALKSAPASAAGNEIVVPSRCAGTVVRLHVRAAGAVVAEGEPLGEVVCAGEALRAEVAIVDNGMGLVAPGQKVKLFYDAFPYQRHGVRYGTVRWIGPSGAPKAEGPAFRVLVDLEQRDFRVRGTPYPLLPGMAGRAEIVVAEQSAIAYVFEPVRAIKENLSRGP